MFCKNCGKQMNDGAKFCPECGTRLDDQTQTDALNENFDGGEDTMLLTEDSAPLNENFDGGEDTMLLTEDSASLNENFDGGEDTMLLTEDSAPLNENFDGGEDTMLLTEDSAPLNENFDGGEDTMLLTEDSAPVNDNFDGGEDTMLLTEDSAPLNDNFDGGENTMLLTEDSAPVNDNFNGGENTMLLSDEPEPSVAPVPVPDIQNSVPDFGNNQFNGAAQQSGSSDIFGNTDPFGANKPVDDNTDTMNIPPLYQQNDQQQYQQGQYAQGQQYAQQQFDPYAPPQGQPGAQQPYFEDPSLYGAPVQEEKRREKLGGVRIFFAVLFTIVTVVCLFALSLCASIKFGANGKSLKKSIKNLDKDVVLSGEFDGAPLSDDIYKTLGIRKITEGNADKEDFKNYLEGTNILEFIGEKVENYANYIIDGDGDDPSVTSDMITNEFFGNKSNNKVAQKELGKKFSSSDLKTINKKLKKNDVDKNLSVKKWKDNVGFDLKNAKYAFSYLTLGIVLAIVLVFLIWIALIVDRRGKHLAGFYGKIFGISGFLMFIIGAAVLAASPIIYAVTGNIIFYLVFHILLKFGIIAIGTGFVELLLAFMFKRIKRRIKVKEKTAKAVEAAKESAAGEGAYQN